MSSSVRTTRTASMIAGIPLMVTKLPTPSPIAAGCRRGSLAYFVGGRGPGSDLACASCHGLERTPFDGAGAFPRV